MGKKYDFSGWATRANTKCSDGRVITPEAFKHHDGMTVPLVYGHQHHDLNQIVGNATLQHRAEGMYAFCSFNDTESGKTARELVKHGDVTGLSICANQLKEQGHFVQHGMIREVSLVLAGANPGAYIENVMMHGEELEDVANIYNDQPIEMCHSEEIDEEEGSLSHEDKTDKTEEGGKEMSENSGKEKTVQEIFDEMTEEQQTVVYAIAGQIAEEAGLVDDDENEGGNKNMKHNLFDGENQVVEGGVLTHADQAEILGLAKSSAVGSLKQALAIYAENNGLEHADIEISGFVQTGNGNVTTMFPEYVEAHPSRTPELITNDMGWVNAIMAKTQKIPHGRVRTSHVDIRNIDALKAKGYKKGDPKNLTGNYDLVRRTTDPQTVYVTSALHRDDVVDIEDFDYVQFQYNIDQISLKETLAVATLLGDERPDSDPEKIFPDKIRPIWKDDELYTIHKDVDFEAMAKELQGENAEQYFGENFIYAEAMVNTLRKARKDYRGTGKPDMFITTDMLSTMILARDRNGRRIYATETELAAALGVANIYEVTQMEDKVRTDGDGKKHKLHAICVNMADYGYGASKGGDITHFTDFDIKFNQLESLLETRKSGQLTRIKSAIVIEELVDVAG